MQKDLSCPREDDSVAASEAHRCGCICCFVLRRIAAVFKTNDLKGEACGADRLASNSSAIIQCRAQEDYCSERATKNQLVRRALEMFLSKGILMRASTPESESTLHVGISTLSLPVLAIPGFSLLPSPFPLRHFQEVCGGSRPTQTKIALCLYPLSLSVRCLFELRSNK